MITGLKTCTPRGIQLICRFGISYIACKPSDLSEDALLGLPMREFWSSSVLVNNLSLIYMNGETIKTY